MSDLVEQVTKAILDAMDLTDGLDGTAAENYAIAAIAAVREHDAKAGFPDWDKKLAERFPEGVPVVSTPFLEMLRSKR